MISAATHSSSRLGEPLVHRETGDVEQHRLEPVVRHAGEVRLLVGGDEHRGGADQRANPLPVDSLVHEQQHRIALRRLEEPAPGLEEVLQLGWEFM